MNDDYIDIPFAKPCRLLDSQEEKYTNDLAKAITCKPSEITFSFYDGRKMTGTSKSGADNRLKSFHKEKELGYVFYYQPTEDVAIPIADFYYINGRYRPIFPYGATIDNLRLELHTERVAAEEEAKKNKIIAQKEARERARKNKRNKQIKYVLQKYVVPAVFISAGSIAALTGIGAIHDAITTEPIAIVQQQPDMYTIANANDVLLVAWSNYAMGELSEISNNSEADRLRNIAEDMRETYFTPIMSSYYGYVEEGLLGLPTELIGESIKTQHNSFRNNTYLFDEELQRQGFTNCTFSNSPFANAIVIDSYGQTVVGSDNGLFGEVYDTNGELITLESDIGYTIYVRAEDIIGNNYGTSNYPEDAIMYKGVAYVSSSHIHDYEEPSIGINQSK